jgi:hypothetical protein
MKTLLLALISRNGKPANSKLWAFVANLLVCAVVVKTHILNDRFDPEFLWGFLAIVGGMGLASKKLENPAAPILNTDPSKSAGPSVNEQKAKNNGEE